jgi:hypothetical protein
MPFSEQALGRSKQMPGDHGIRTEDLEISVTGKGRNRRLRVSAQTELDLRAFEGTVVCADQRLVLTGPLTAANAAAVRTRATWLQPRPLGLRTSAGVGDRIGAATAGQARGFALFGTSVAPVFAQQSIREMARTGRTPQQVMTDATFGCVEAGWRHPVGADGDHIKDVDGIDRCLEAGFSLFSLDPGDHVRTIDEVLPDTSSIAWETLEDDEKSMLRRYRGGIDIGDEILHIDERTLLRAALKYSDAVAFATRMYRHLVENARRPVEVEVCVDETDEVTSLAEHVYMATEFARLGVSLISFAPRYVGDFQKAVPYRGDLDALFRDLQRHASVARTLGPYKLSLHSGSDKFEIYDAAVAATDGAVHLKTSGTSYLEALALVAESAPELFREIYRVSREAFRTARKSYQVTARLASTPEANGLQEDEMRRLLIDPGTRQILHVGFGEVLCVHEDAPNRHLYEDLRRVLDDESDILAQRLEQHISRHLAHFGQVA